MRKKRSVLKLWMAIALTFAAMIGIVGGTVLTLFLMGKFNEEKILPQTIFFNENLKDEDLGFYENGTFFVAGDFNLTISSSTENVTEKIVEMRFGSTASMEDAEGYISNGVVKLPKFVTLDKPFRVTLEKDLEGNFAGNMDKSTILTAVSENVNASRPSVEIKVDVPVGEIDLFIHSDNSQSSSETKEVVKGTQFVLDTKFLPKNSEFCFSDSSQKKSVFYAVNPSSLDFVEYDWETGKFFAKQNSGANFAEVTAYAFANSYYQTLFMDSFEEQFPNATKKQLTETVINHFTINPIEYISKEIKIKVRDVKVDAQNVSFANITSPVRVTADKTFTLTANSYYGNANLGLSIKDEYGASHSELFGNVGIKIDKTANLKIVGGKLMKVENNAGIYTMTKVDYNPAYDYANDSSAEYYVLPNETPKDYVNYYWEMTSSATTPVQINLCLNYFQQTDEGEWKNLFTFKNDANINDTAVEKQLTVEVSQSSYENKPAWEESLQPIKMEVSYDESGATVPSNVDLANLLKQIDENNVYRTVKYFLLADGSDLNLKNHFLCNVATAYNQDYTGKPLSIENITMPNGGYQLYELDSSILTAISSFSNGFDETKVYVVAATIKTDAYGKVDKDGDKYKIVNLSRAKQVDVSSALSIVNMAPTFSIKNAEEMWVQAKGGYFIPVYNFNEDGTIKTVLEFTLSLNIKSDSDAQKLLNAFKTVDEEGNRLLDVVDQNSGKKYLELQSLSDPEIQNNNAVFTGVISLNDSAFNANRNYDGQEFKLQLVYNDGKEIYTKNVLNMEDSRPDSFFVYYQKPDTSKFTGEYLTNHPSSTDGVLDDFITVSNGDETILKWVKKSGVETEISGATLLEKVANLNRELSFTILDQFGRTIHSSVNSVRLEEENETFSPTTSPVIALNNDSTQIVGFSAAKDQTTYLAVYVVDNKTTDVDKYIYTDSAKQNRLTLPKIKFEISSEGVARLETDVSDVLGTPQFETVVDNNGNNITGSATVAKYVTTGANDTVNMNDLLKVYTGTNQQQQSNLIFKLASGNHSEISSMVDFKYDRNNPENVTAMQFLAPFGTETAIRFKVTNLTGTFEIDFAFVCKADATISNNFRNYVNSQNKEFLKASSTNVLPSVFAGESYTLDDYLKIISQKGNTYTWANMSFTSSQDGLFYDQSGDLCKINNGVLTIADVYSYKTVTFSLYYSVRSSLAPHIDISLYVNPNIIINQKAEEGELPFVNVDKLASDEAVFETTYKFYRATSFIENKFSFDGLEEFNVDGQYYKNLFTFNNVSDRAEQFVNIENGKYVVNPENVGILNLTLGEAFLQTFKIRQGVDFVDAIFVKMVEGVPVVTLSTPEDHATLYVNLGFGSNEADTLMTIFGEDVAFVTFNGRTHILLSVGELKQFVDNSFSLDSISSNDLGRGNGGVQAASQISGIFSPVGNNRNSFTVKKIIGGNLTVVISIDAIVSRVGQKFMYYGNGGTELKYNNFADVDFSILISNNISDLESNKVYQSLNAGKTYTIGHKLTNVRDEATGIITEIEEFDEEIGKENYTPFGFYYNSSLGVQARYQLISVEGISLNFNGQIVGRTNIDGLVSIDENSGKLTINHLAEGLYDEVFVLARITLTNGASSFSWFYRIKVEPSFKNGFVEYPFAEDVEHLDSLSSYFDEQNGYQINLSEAFTKQNSNAKHVGAVRFNAPKILAEDTYFDTATAEDFSIAKVTLNSIDVTSNIGTYLNTEKEFFTQNENGIFLNLKLKPGFATSAISVTVRKEFKVAGRLAVGSELYYTFAFNQGDNYDFTLTSKDGQLAETDKTLFADIEAGTTENTFTAYMQINNDRVNIRPTTNYDVFVNGARLDEALMKKAYVKKGTVLDETENVVLQEDYVFGDWLDGETTAASVGIEIDGKTYTYNISSSDTNIGYKYAYLTLGANNTKILHLCPKASVKEDTQVEISFFTDQKIARKLIVNVTSYFKWSLNETNNFNFVGGETYKFDKTAASDGNYIFENIYSNTTGHTIQNVIIEKANEDKTIKLGDTFGGKEVTLDKLVSISPNEENWKESTIIFAHLTQDVTFTFKASITESNGNIYVFNFDIKVKASFNQTSAVYDAGVYIGGQEIDEPILSNINDIFNDGFAIKKEDGMGWNETAEVTGETAQFEISNYKIVYIFGGKDLFNIPLTVRYRSQPNVTVKPNYPTVDGKNELQYEYIAAKQENEDDAFIAQIENFFGGIAQFATESRISVTGVTKTDDSTMQTQAESDKSWKITLEDSSNVTVYDGKTSYPNASSNVIFEGVSLSVPSITFTFTLADGTTNGTVVFGVEVNKVKTSYTVHVVRNNIVNLVSTSVSPIDGFETIYAEDLAKQDKEIFAQDRILTYNLKSAGTYYLNFVNNIEDGQTKVVKITGAVGTNVMDLGQSLMGYSFSGVYGNYNETQKTLSDERKVEDVFVDGGLPTLTARVAAYYADGTKIVMTDERELVYTEASSESENAASLVNFVFNKSGEDISNYEKTLNVSLQDGTETVATGMIYNVRLGLDFTVKNNADKIEENALPTYAIIEATSSDDEALTLLSDQINSTFGIARIRENELYTQSLMAQLGGNLTLKEYGFAGVSTDDSLSKAASSVHEMLIHNERANENGVMVKYFTGLTPRAGAEATYGEISGDSNKNNYIVIIGNRVGTRATDWTILAQGANNDGNFVMMRLTYSVDLGDFEVSTSHNILFKVLPNSTITFKNSFNELVDADVTDTFDGNQTIATNKLSPYQIDYSAFTSDEAEQQNIVLFDTNNQSQSVVTANMHGSDEDSANKFTYTYTVNKKSASTDSTSYNDWSELNKIKTKDEAFSSDSFSVGWKLETSNERLISAISESNEGSLAINVKNLELGERYFFVEFADDFGFKGRFYFTLISSENPTISQIEASYSEGQQLAFGLNSTKVNANKPAEGATTEVEYQTFRYGNKSLLSNQGEAVDVSQDKLANTLQITKEGADITGASLTLTLNQELKLPNGETETSENISIKAGTVLTKDIALDFKDNSCFIDILDNAEWKYNNGKDKITLSSEHEQLINSEIILKLTIKPISTTIDGTTTYSSVGKISAIYGVKEASDTAFKASYETEKLKVRYTQGEGIAASIKDNSNNIKLITLTGIKAFAFANSDGAFDENSVEDFISKVNDIKVKKVEFFYQGEPLGASEIKESEDEKFKTNLITSENHSYLGETITDGAKSVSAVKGTQVADDSNKFAVPYLDGILFGTNTSLANVEMQITLVDKGGNSCVLKDTITIRRESSNKVFEESQSIINDNEAPKVAKAYKEKVYNDTLQVVLEKNESITFVVNDKEILKVEGNILTEADEAGEKTKTAKLITLTNTNNYAVTRYIGISESIVGQKHNFVEGEDFHIFVVSHTKDGKPTEDSPKILYNDNSLDFAKETASGETTSTKIVEYTSITLRIANINEIRSEMQKPEQLYFLIKEEGAPSIEGGNKIYQEKVTFNVKPRFSAYNTGDDVVVKEYLKLEGEETHYVIALEDWASDLKLKQADGEVVTGEVKPENAYMFKFEIRDTAGVATIDENGTITTLPGFVPEDGVFNVRVYMKVSGNEGTYEDNNTNLLLGTYRIRLAQYEDMSEIGNTKDATTSTELLTGAYEFKNQAIVVLPENYTVKACGFELDEKNFVWLGEPNYKLDTTLSCTTNTAVNLHDLFDKAILQPASSEGDAGESGNLDLSDLQNKSYYVSKVNGQIIWKDNLNSITLQNAGEYEVKFLMSYWEKENDNKSRNTAQFSVKIVAYGDSSSEVHWKSVALGSVIQLNISESEKWWQLDDNNNTAQTEDNFKATTKGLHTMKYLVQTTDNATGVVSHKVVTYNFIVYEHEKNLSFALVQGTRFSLKNLLEDKEEQGRFYSVEDGSAENGTVVTDAYFLNYGINTSVSRTYVFVGANSTIKFNVRFKIVSGQGSQVTQDDYLNLGQNKELSERLQIINAVQNALEINISNVITEEDVTGSFTQAAFLLIQVREGNEKLTNLDEYDFETLSENKMNKINFVVTYRESQNGPLNIKTLTINFYPHSGEYSIECIEKEENLGFEVSNWADAVKSELVGKGELNEVTFFQITNGALQIVDRVNVKEASQTEIFYVQVRKDSGEFEYYLFSITYQAADYVVNDAEASVSLDEISKAMSNVSFENIRFYKDAACKNEITSIPKTESDSIGLYAKVDESNKVYAFLINFKTQEVNA